MYICYRFARLHSHPTLTISRVLTSHTCSQSSHQSPALKEHTCTSHSLTVWSPMWATPQNLKDSYLFSSDHYLCDSSSISSVSLVFSSNSFDPSPYLPAPLTSPQLLEFTNLYSGKCTQHSVYPFLCSLKKPGKREKTRTESVYWGIRSTIT